MLVALTREVSPALEHCELTHVARAPLSIDRARQQHDDYERALEALGCRVERLPAAPDLPDSVFVEDVAIVFDEIALITRPGAVSRRPETQAVAERLTLYRPLVTMESPGTLDGGDVLRVGRAVFVGRSSRSNDEGIDALRRTVEPLGYVVHVVDVRGCLHLKSAITRLDDGTLLLNRNWIDAEPFRAWRLIEVDPAEPHGANALAVAGAILYPAAFPRTHARLEAHGLQVESVDVSELQKAEGAVTCCSLVFVER